jgi:light-harvesting complex I chlorophyll a/b binding protein 5
MVATMSLASAKTASFAGRSLRSTSSARPAAARRTVMVAAADRPLWFPGNKEAVPDYLDGSLVGDHGFDPLGLGSSPEQLSWNVHAEIFHGRLAMTGVAGILLTSLLHKGGADVPEWYEAGRVYLDRNPNVSFGALLFSTIVLSGFVEFKRLNDIRNPGSQGSGILPEDFKGVGGPQGRTVGGPYVGGRFFDPMGLCRGSPEQTLKYKWNEIRNGRLAMMAFLGFAAQYAATGKGPIDNLIDHVSDPFHTTFVYNGVSVPFISQ